MRAQVGATSALPQVFDVGADQLLNAQREQLQAVSWWATLDKECG